MRTRSRRPGPGAVARRALTNKGPSLVPDGCVLVHCGCSIDWVIAECTYGRSFCWTCGERFERAASLPSSAPGHELY